MRTSGIRASPSPSTNVRSAALGGVIGPAVFIGAWTISAAITTREYSTIDDAISGLAAVGADSRPLMTAGFIGFGVAVPVYAAVLRRVVGGAAWLTATATGIATLAVSATPLDRSTTTDTWHAVFAGIGYVTLAATHCSRRARCCSTGIVPWADSASSPVRCRRSRWSSRPAACRPGCSNAWV